MTGKPWVGAGLPRLEPDRLRDGAEGRPPHAPLPTTAGQSSFRMVPVAVPNPAMVALLGLERTTVKVSFGSIAVSPITWTMI